MSPVRSRERHATSTPRIFPPTTSRVLSFVLTHAGVARHGVGGTVDVVPRTPSNVPPILNTNVFLLMREVDLTFDNTRVRVASQRINSSGFNSPYVAPVMNVLAIRSPRIFAPVPKRRFGRFTWRGAAWPPTDDSSTTRRIILSHFVHYPEFELRGYYRYSLGATVDDKLSTYDRISFSFHTSTHRRFKIAIFFRRRGGYGGKFRADFHASNAGAGSSGS